MAKSALCIPSFVYFRTSPSIHSDQSFVESISGQSELKAVKKKLKALSKAKLTYEQKIELREGSICQDRINADKSQTHGLAADETGPKWSCRCEIPECKHYSKCMADPFALKISRGQNSEAEAQSLYSYSALGISFGSREEALYSLGIISAPGAEGEEQAESSGYTLNKGSVLWREANRQEPADDGLGFTQAFSGTLSGQKGFNAQNCPPPPQGYALAEPEAEIAYFPADEPIAVEGAGTELLLSRYVHLTDNLGIKREEILLVCSSQRTKSLLVQKAATLGYDIAQNFADYENMPSLNTGAFEHMIACETEAVPVAARERFLSCIESAKTAFTLLGDRYYRMPSDSSYKEYFKKYDETLAEKAKLVRFASSSNPFIAAIDASDENAAHQAYSALASDAGAHNGHAPVYLLPTEAHAVYYSSMLWAKGVSNTLISKQQTPIPLSRWVADMLWDIKQDQIGEESFMELYEYRVGPNASEARMAFGILAEAYGDGEAINLKNMLSGAPPFPIQLKEAPLHNAYVSSIESALPFRFDRAVIAFEPKNPVEEAFTGYIATIAGSGKVSVAEALPIKGLKLIASGRCVAEGADSQSAAIQIGMPQDMDVSFYSPSNPKSMQIQSHIARKVNDCDPADLELRASQYYIVHSGVEIGALSAQASAEIASLSRSGKLTGVYVSGLCTYISDGAFRLGVTAIGMANAD